jgi:hypothetical protein
MLHQGIDVRQSGIEGSGLFASTVLEESSILWRLDPQDKPISIKELLQYPKERQRLAYTYRDNTTILTTDGSQFMNHSCDPNTWWADDETLIASREIPVGEEVTFDYATTDIHDWWRPKWECQCGAANCRRIITGRDCLDPDFQARYQGHLPTWVVAYIQRTQGIRGWISACVYAGAEVVRKVKALVGIQSSN